MKKILCAVLVLSLVMASVVGCGKKEVNNSNSETTKTSNSKTTKTSSNGEPMKISMTLMGGPKIQDTWLEKEMEKKLNVDFDFIMLPGWGEKDVKTNLLMSDKETMPDVLWFSGQDKEYKQWKEAGILVDMLPLLQNTEEQNILKYYNKDVFFASYDDGLYKLGGDVPEKSCTTTIVRKDWLDKLGLEAPTTVDEFIEVARAFTFDDPDGNGKDDTYGYSGSKLAGKAQFSSFWPIWAAYGTNPDHFIITEDGNIKYGATLPETKEALKVLRDMYAEGIMDPTIITGNDFDGEVFPNGKTGMFYRWIAFFNPGAGNRQNFDTNNPKAELIHIDPIKGPNGFGSDQPGNGAAWCDIAITTHAKDPQAIVNALDKMMGEELFILRKFGEEGVHYKIEDGVFRNIVEIDKLNEDGIGSFGWILERKDKANINNSPEVIEMFENAIDSCKPMDEKTAFFIEKNRPVWLEYSSDIIDLRDTTFYGIITGEEELDAFDKFVEQYYAMGGKQIEEEANEYYNAQKEDYKTFDSIYEKSLKPNK